MQVRFRTMLLSALLLVSGICAAADTIKIALIDPLSGPYAMQGHLALRHFQAAAEFANKNGGALGLKLEIVPIDDKSSVEEAVASLQLAIDLGIRYIAQGVGSEITAALIAAINEHNDSNPARAVVLLNHGAGDPALTGALCSYWHLQFEANDLMKVSVLTAAIAANPAVNSVYLINQDNTYGQRIASETLRLLAEKRPEIRVVGDELHAANSLRDFSPYAARLAASGADAVVTGNAGDDLSLLIEAAGKANVYASFYTLNAALMGTPATIAAARADVRNLTAWHSNLAGNRLEVFARQYREKYEENWQRLPIYLSVHMLVTSMETARGLEPARVLPVIEGLSFLGPNGPVSMRKEDHQLLQPLFVARFVKADAGGVSIDSEGTGYGWKTELRVETDRTAMPTTCRMLRPK